MREFCAERGIERPHVVGNSLGGWVALELAKLGGARSVTALSPAGLWRDHNPVSSQASLVVARSLAVATRPVASTLGRSRILRTAGLALTFARPWRVPAEVAADQAVVFSSAPSYWPVFWATRTRRFVGGRDIAVPITIAFGTRDRLLTPSANAARDQLPPHVVEVRLVGCGHAPTWDDPDAVVRVIRETTRRA